MRHAAPLLADQRIGNHGRTVVLLVQAEIELGKRIRRDRHTCLRHPVALDFELFEHGLAEQRALEAVKQVVNEIRLLLAGLRLTDQVVVQQDLVGNRSNLRDKHLILRVEEVVTVVGMPEMHGVTQLMRKHKGIFKGIVKVHQDKGMGRIDRVAVCADALALVLDRIDPAVLKRLAEQRKVMLAERRKTLEQHLLCLLVSHAALVVL